MITPATDAELHAYLDGELEPARHDEIAGLIGADAVLAERVAAYAADGQRLRRAFADAAARPLDPAWISRIERGMAPPPRHLPWPTRRTAIAASLAAVACGTGATWWRLATGDTILSAAEAARDSAAADGRLPVPALRDALLQERTGLRVRAPDLGHFGFQPVQLQLYGTAGRGAAQLRYRDPAGRVLTIYVRGSDGQVRFDLLRRGAMRVCVWQDDVVGAVIIAPMSAGEMLRVASSAYSALNL